MTYAVRKEREAVQELVAAGTSSAALVHYSEMCRAIARAYEVDEVQHIRDKALALQTYAAQARNTEAERQACEIRLRAERRCGQLLRAMEKAKGAQGSGSNQYQEVPSQVATAPRLANLGLSRDQSSRWQKLAEIPEDQFEAAVTNPDVMPTTTGIIAAHAEPRRLPVDHGALWLWGRLLDFERDGLLGRDPATMFETMLPHMRETVAELAPRVATWLERIAP